MRKETVNRIKQLETSIYTLREINRSETLRDKSRERNQHLILSYTNEVFNDITDELDRDKRPLDYSHIDWLGYEYISN